MLLTRIYKRSELWVRGTSIVETVVAMTILLTVLTLGLIRIDRVNASVNPQSVYKAYLASSTVLEEGSLLIELPEEYEVEGFLVKKQLLPLEDGIIHVTLSVYNASGKLQYTRELLRRHDIKF